MICRFASYGNPTGALEMLRPAATPTVNSFMMNEKPADVLWNMMKPMDLFHHPMGKEDLSKMAADSRTVQQRYR